MIRAFKASVRLEREPGRSDAAAFGGIITRGFRITIALLCGVELSVILPVHATKKRCSAQKCRVFRCANTCCKCMGFGCYSLWNTHEDAEDIELTHWKMSFETIIFKDEFSQFQNFLKQRLSTPTILSLLEHLPTRMRTVERGKTMATRRTRGRVRAQVAVKKPRRRGRGRSRRRRRVRGGGRSGRRGTGRTG